MNKNRAEVVATSPTSFLITSLPVNQGEATQHGFLEGDKMKFSKKPIVVEAVQFHMPKVRPLHPTSYGDRDPDTTDIMGLCWSDFGSVLQHPCVWTLNGLVSIEDGEWIIKGIEGEFYPCKPHIFKATYEQVTIGTPVTTEETK